MDDIKRESIVRKSAYGYVFCIGILFTVAVVFGKSYGRIILLTLMPLYSLYYAVMYQIICNGYEDEIKRISAFGILGRGTFVGAMYYLSILIVVLTLFLIIGSLYVV